MVRIVALRAGGVRAGGLRAGVLRAGLALALCAAGWAPVAQASDRRAQIEKVRDGLNDPDPLVRLVTLEEVAAGDDALIRSLALRQAIGIADPDLQALAARMFFAGLSTFSLDLKDAKVTGGNPEKAKDLLTTLSQALVNFQVDGFVAATGAFKIAFQDEPPKDGQVTGIAATFKTVWTGAGTNCETVLRLGEALDLAGTMVCERNGHYVTVNVSRKFY